MVMPTLLRRFVDYASTPRNLAGASVIRIMLGIILLCTQLQHLGDAAFFWGPHGQMPFVTFIEQVHLSHTFSLYAIGSSDAWFTTVFAASIIVTFAFTVGLFSRLSGTLVLLFTWSMWIRNQWLLDGGNDILLLTLIYLAFADTGRYLSVDRMLALRRGLARPVTPVPSVLGVLHNYAILAILLQIALLYFFSTFYKIEGHKWQDGTALYYILRCADFNMSPLNRVVYESPFFVTAGTYSVLVFQSMFVWLMWNRRAKPVVVAGVLLLHIGIAVFMGLFWFSSTVIAVDALLISDAQYRRFGTYAAQIWHDWTVEQPAATESPAYAKRAL